MIIKDRIYGRFVIQESVIKELIKSKPVQRLKKIAQFGIPDKYYFVDGYSRYEHSIGVMILLRKLNANLEAQIAGLLHDVSHLAFSHVADWVFGFESEENLQDTNHEQAFKKGEINRILIKYKFRPAKIADLQGFILLDREIPNLCADRIDYCLREFINYANNNKLKYCLCQVPDFLYT